MASAFAPDSAGTLLPDGTRWGKFEGGEITNLAGSVLADYSVEILASGFRWTEGPTWIAASQCLIFSDTIDACLYKWREGEGVSVLATESGGYDGANVANFDQLFEPGSNGIALKDGWLYICQHPTRRIVRIKLSDLEGNGGQPFHQSSFEVLADRSPEGRSLNAPNDIIVAPNDDVYFTDPIYGFLKKQPVELGYAYLNAERGEHPDQPYVDECCETEGAGYKGVYRLRDGRLECVTRELERPNGLAFSKDGRFLWVINSHKSEPSLTAYHMSDELPLERSHRLDADNLGSIISPGPDKPGLTDGMKIDDQERIWTSAPGGVLVIDSKEICVLGRVDFKTNVSNIEFGENGDVFVTGLGHLWRLKRKA